MCLACVHNPFDFIEAVKRAAREKKMSREQVARIEAKHLKETLAEIDATVASAPHCDVGRDIVDAIRERQFELSREL